MKTHDVDDCETIVTSWEDVKLDWSQLYQYVSKLWTIDQIS